MTCTDTTTPIAAVDPGEPVLRKSRLDRNGDPLFWFEFGLNKGNIAYACVMQFGGFAWLEEVAVHPDHRGQGLATRLLTEVIAELGSQELRLCCEVFPPDWDVHRPGLDVDQLRAWYGRYGFQPDSGSRLVRPVGQPTS